jgi:glycosyltransferase involved in cell wall biosynthesis
MRVTVACPGGRLGALAQDRGAEVVEWRAVRQPGIGAVAEWARLRRIIAEVQPDVVHLHCAKAGLIGRLVLRGRVPTVFSPHAWSFFAVDGLMRRAVLGWERFATRWTSAAVCVSAAERESGVAAGIGGRLVVLPNEVSPSSVDAVRALTREEVRAQLGVATPLAVCAARLARQKGQDVLVDAWETVRAAVPDAELVLVGDGPDRAALQAAAGPGVRFAGTADRDASLRWLHAADVVVCPSRWEGMSLVPLEAMALGRPLVVTDVDGMTEVVPPSVARLVAPEDVTSLGHAIAAVLIDPDGAEKAGRIGREHALTVGAGERSADQLLALYGELAARGRLAAHA